MVDRILTLVCFFLLFVAAASLSYSVNTSTASTPPVVIVIDK